MVNINLTQTITKDTTAFGSAPTENHGQSTLIAADSNSYGYMQFDMPAGATDPARVVSATIRIKVFQAATTALTLRYASSAWDENTLTWNNKPAFVGTTYSIASRAYAAGSYYDLDVTNLVKGFLNGSVATNNGIAIIGGSQRVVWYSGENDPADAPLFTIVYDSPVVSVSIPVTPALGSGAMPAVGIVPGKTKNIPITPALGSGAMPDVAVTAEKFSIVQRPVLDDANIRSNGSVSDKYTSTARVYRTDQVNDQYVFKIDLGNFTNRTFQYAQFVFTAPVGANTSLWDIYEVSNDWSDAAGNVITNAPITGPPLGTLSVPAHNGEALVRVPISADYIKANTGVHSFRFVAQSGSDDTISTIDRGNNTAPYFEYKMNYVADAAVNVPVDPMLGNGNTPEWVVSTAKNVSINVQPATGSSNAPSWTVSSVRNVVTPLPYGDGTAAMPEWTVDAEIVLPDATVPFDAAIGSGEMPDVNVIGGYSTEFTVAPADGSADMPEWQFSSKTEVKIAFDAMVGSGRMPKVQLIINDMPVVDGSDPYFTQTVSSTDSDDIWYRFNERTGDRVIKDEKGGKLTNATAYGNPIITDGIPMHRAMEFDGVDDYLEVADSNPRSLGQGSLEFYIRTDVKNQAIMFGSGYEQVGAPGVTSPVIVGGVTPDNSSLYELVDGHIRITNGGSGNYIYDGIKDIADGQWHQVVLTAWWYAGNTQNDYTAYGLQKNGIAIFVDGKLDKRIATRETGGNSTFLAQPDSIGRVQNRYFTGALSEIVHRAYLSVPKYTIEQAYYAYFGMNVQNFAFAGSGEMPKGTKFRGNAIRILALHYRFSPSIGGNISFAQQDIPGLDTAWTVPTRVDSGVPLARYGNIYPPFRGTDSDINKSIDIFPGAKMFYQSVFYKNARATSVDDFFRDPITDEPTTINLQTDIDLDEFDAIYLVDFPGVQFALNNPDMARNAERAHGQFLESLRTAVFDDGKKLYLASPDAAKELGFVKNFDSKLVFWDSKPAEIGYSADFSRPGSVTGTGKRDYRSAYDNPFINREAELGRVTPLRDELAKATGNPRNVPESMYNYYDTHRNKNHRFVANVPQFSDIPGFFLNETMWYRQDVQDYDKVAQLSFKYLGSESAGALVGQESVIQGPVGVDEDTYVVGGNARVDNYYLISFKPSDILIGTPVTKESAVLDIGTTRVANPTAENATIILIPSGAELDGRVMQGQVVINPNDNAAYSEGDMYTYFQEAHKTDIETKKVWQVSGHRLPLGRVEIDSTSTSVITGKNGASAVLVSSSKRSESQVGEVPRYAVRRVGTTERSWNWLVQPTELIPEGEVRVRINPMQGAGEMPDVAIGSAKNVSIGFESMIGSGFFIASDKGIKGDISVVIEPARGSGTMPNPSTVIRIDAMQGSGVLPLWDNLSEYELEGLVHFTVSNPKQITFTRIGDK